MKTNLIRFLLASVFLGATQLLRAELITNPGFETGDLTGWTLTGAHSAASDNGIYYGVDFQDSHTGAFGAYFGTPGDTQTLSQLFATTPGTTYTVSFWLGQAPASQNPYTNSVELTFDSAVLLSQSGVPSQAFTEYSFSQPATASSTRLAFTFRDDLGFFSLDDVSVSKSSVATPEPGTFFPIVLALGAILRARLRGNILSIFPGFFNK